MRSFRFSANVPFRDSLECVSPSCELDIGAFSFVVQFPGQLVEPEIGFRDASAFGAYHTLVRKMNAAWKINLNFRYTPLYTVHSVE